MKPTPLPAMSRRRLLFARGLRLRWLHSVAMYAATVSIGLASIIAIGYMLAVGSTGN